MKKIIGLLSCLLIFGSCDDGDITTKGVEFDPNAPVKSCSVNNGLYYKINGPEALILQTPPTSFTKEVTGNQPRTVLIDNNTKVLLRSFNNTVTASYFCSVIPSSTPIVTEEWDALPGVSGQSGYLEITTTVLVNQTTKDTTGYNHNIVFKNITFANSKSSFVYDNYVYGTYTTAKP